MSFLGKILAGFIGYKLLGPFGLLLGLWIGHFIDQGDKITPRTRYQPRSHYFFKPQESKANLEKKHLTFFVCVFSMLSKLAKADGSITADEIAVVDRFMHDELSLDPSRVKIARDAFRSARISPRSFDDYAREFYGVFGTQRVMMENLLDILLRLSLADGQLDRREEELIKSAAKIFKLAEPDMRRLRSRYTEQPDKPYAILGVTKKSTVGEIKKQYRKLAKENHPDAVRASGQPEEFIRIANDKFRAIQEAYEAVKAEKGF